MAHHRRRRPGSCAGFTLVELLVVIAIIATLVGLILPAVQSARESARRTGCTNNLRQVGLAVAAHEVARKVYPQGRGTRGPDGYSWAFRLLPFLEEEKIFGSWVPDALVYDARNTTAMRSPVAGFFCPSRRGPCNDRNFDNNDQAPVVTAAAAGGDYAANAGSAYTYAAPEGGISDPRLAGPIHTFSRVKPVHVTDGLSKTFAVGERHIPPVDPSWPPELVHLRQGDTAFFAADTPATQFRDTYRGLADGPDDRNVRKFGSRHPGVTNFVFLDGHVESIANDTDPQVLLWYGTIGDGNDPGAAQDGGAGGT